jgi:hypothetical protein
MRGVSVQTSRSGASYCQRGGRLAVTYPSSRLLAALGRRARAAVRDRAVLLTSGNRHYALRGVRPGTRLTTARRHLRLGRGLRIGRTTLYVVAHRWLVGVRRGRVQELGVAERRVLATRTLIRRLL